MVIHLVESAIARLNNQNQVLVVEKLNSAINQINCYPEDPGRAGWGVLPYKGLMGTCGQPGYVFRDFCLKQDIKFIIFCLNQGID